MKTPVKTSRGFTLIESLVTLAMTLMIVAGMYEVYSLSRLSYQRQQLITEMYQNARASIEFMARELRNAVLVEEIDANSISFYTDLDVPVISTSTGANAWDTINDNLQSWGPNDRQDQRVMIISGRGAPQMRRILSNTSTQLVVSPSWDPNFGLPDETSGYRILENKRFLLRADAILRYTKGQRINQPLTENITGLKIGYLPDQQKITIELTARTPVNIPQADQQIHFYTVTDSIVLRNG